MSFRIAINGFGRIGRLVLRAIIEQSHSEIEVVAINDSAPIETNAYLLRYDSVHGTSPFEIKIENNHLIVPGQDPIKKLSNRNPLELPWKSLDVDIVLECTGVFRDYVSASQHLQAGAKRVLVSAPCKDADQTIVFGVNHHLISSKDYIISCASCTTNALAPLAKILNETIGIEKGYMTTIHAYTRDQTTLDHNHKDLYRARAANLSMIPTTTGATKAVEIVLPELKGKLGGSSVRVPTPNVSAIDFKFMSDKRTSVDEINQNIIKSAETSLKGIISCTEEPIVSIDLNHNSNSSIFVLPMTSVIDENFVRVFSWYDNEWGFSSRMIDVAKEISQYL